MTPNANHPVSRRQWLQISSTAFGSLALAALASDVRAADRRSLSTKATHFAPRAKHVIFLFMDGGPSQVDLLDYKPELQKRHGENGRRENRQLMRSPWQFAQHGQSGQWFSQLLPHLSQEADRLCVIKSMQTDSSAHPLAIPLLHTGSFQFTRPSMGSWVVYGLGTENQNLPGFITVDPTRVFGGPSNYGSAFLPTAYQAVPISKKSLQQSTLDLTTRKDMPESVIAARQELTQTFNRSLLQREQAIHQVEGAIESLGLSIRMQQTMPEVMDLSSESKETLELYGVDDKHTDHFARQCLLARRCVESGVRFVQLSHKGWDHHTKIETLKDRCAEVDKPISALLIDLDRRGLLEDTLVFWTGEFGRQPEEEHQNDKPAGGRNHNADAFSIWMAGGGVRPGLSYGITDELGFEAVENKVHMRDLHATILHLLGLDHTKLTYRYSGRDFRLTDVYGKVVHDIIA